MLESDASASRASKQSIVAATAVGVAMLLTYGYEVFNFNLSLDEPVFVGSGQIAMAREFTAQGRWGMALQYAVLPETILPTISTGLGVLLVGCSLWIIATRVLGLPPIVAGLVTGTTATLPFLGFAMSFSTIAVGIGLGFGAVALFGLCARSTHPTHLVVALAAGTLALGIYQAFAFSLLVVCVALVSRAVSWRRTALSSGLLLVMCFVANAVLGKLAKVALGAGDNSYVNTLMDLDGLWREPVGRLVAAVRVNWNVIAPGGTLFDRLQPWFAIALAGLVVLALRSVVRNATIAPRPVAAVCLALVALVPVGASLVVAQLPLRSMVYLPVCVLVLASIAFSDRQEQSSAPGPVKAQILPWLGATVCVLAVIANASVTNNAYVAAEAAYTQDTFLAMRINEELGRLFPDATGPVPIVVTAPNRREQGTVGNPIEQFGLSLFSGESWRATSFLNTQGVQVAFPTDEQEQAGLAALEDMPAYPSAGWARDLDGILIANLGPDD